MGEVTVCGFFMACPSSSDDSTVNSTPSQERRFLLFGFREIGVHYYKTVRTSILFGSSIPVGETAFNMYSVYLLAEDQNVPKGYVHGGCRQMASVRSNHH